MPWLAEFTCIVSVVSCFHNSKVRIAASSNEKIEDELLQLINRNYLSDIIFSNLRHRYRYTIHRGFMVRGFQGILISLAMMFFLIVPSLALSTEWVSYAKSQYGFHYFDKEGVTSLRGNCAWLLTSGIS